jgi:mannitol/fructose-specific phosphotransferase system IIA component (Ntr-type)
MKSFIDALQEGRLVELPHCDKDKALEYLAILLEAVPGVTPGVDIVKAVKEREAAASTALGRGIACPHVRAGEEGELLCSIGWSPLGIDFNAADGKKVHLVVMYCIPSSQKGSYLKEVSGIAKAVKESGQMEILSDARDLQDVRGRLLDWVDLAIGKAIPDARARMIKLEERSVKADAVALEAGKPSILPFEVVVEMPGRAFVLCSDEELLAKLESPEELQSLVLRVPGQEYNSGRFHVRILSASSFLKGRSLFAGVAVRTGA